MYNIFTKSLLLFSIFTILSLKLTFAQTITIGNVDPGPYAPGSTITASINVTGTCANTATTYNLYLSDATGNFANETLIGSFSNFYTTFVNGIIPAGTPAGTGYEVQVVSVTPTITSTTSTPFTISAGSGVAAGVSSQLLDSTNVQIMGICNGTSNTVYTFVNGSTAGATVTATFFNELTQNTEGVITPTAAGTNFTANAAHYLVTVKAVKGGIVGTESYFLVNNSVNTSFGVSGNSNICLTGGGSLVYNVDITSTVGIQNNFPGLIYNVNWGDGTTSAYILCDIVTAGGKISHIYTKESCGNNPNGQANSFEVDFQPNNPYCGKTGTQVTSYAQVITSPKNIIGVPIAACVNTLVTFANNSDPGQDPKSSTFSCTTSNALYTWMVDGVVAASNYTLSQPFLNTFTTTGVHTITLHLQNGSPLCFTKDTTQSVCIQNPPQPIFTLPFTTGCLPVSLTPVNQSVIDSNCNSTNSYVWSVTGPGPISYGNNTNVNSAQPKFVFSTPGVYQFVLGISTASCGLIQSQPQTVVIDSVVTASLSPDTVLCGGNQTLNFNPSPGPTQTFLKGDAQNTPGTYTWTITGGSYTYADSTSSSSQYPQIYFSDLATYTISVVNQNACGKSVSATQKITFLQAPYVNAGNDSTFCGSTVANLHGTVNGTVTGRQWVGGSGTFTPDRNSLTPTYAPAPAEVNAGTVTLKLVAGTILAPPCDTVTSSVTLTISKPDSITSAPTATACSAEPLNYQMTAAIPFSNFTWTVDPTKTTASASGYTTNGKGTTINDVLENSDPINNAIVTYDILAAGSSGCVSKVFELTVSVSPKQSIANFTENVSSGCDSLNVQFTNTSTPINSSFIWNFGDGTPPSTAVNPFHTFVPRLDGRDTIYTVTLNILSNCGNSQPYSSTITVRPKTPVAFISPEALTGCSPFTLTVDNYSPGNNVSYTYYLYSGNTLVQQITVPDTEKIKFNPITTTKTQLFSLYMVATGYCGNTGQSNIIPITISAENVVAQMFLENGLNKGCVPLNVNFVNNSTGADTYSYTIYNSSNVAIDQQPAGIAPLPYVFNIPGSYYVTLTASNSCYTVVSQPARVNAYAVPSPQFTADDTTGCKSAIVNFTNLTPGDSTTAATSLLYDWNFGDGSPDAFTLIPPPHTYTFHNSPFTVTLTATDLSNGCSNVFKKTAYINIAAPPFTAFTEKPDSVTSIPNYTFSFIDKTTGGPTKWNWSFGDGDTSRAQNPDHTYPDTGFYKVTLTTSSLFGCDSTISHIVRVTGVPGQLFLPNAFEPAGGTSELKIFMAKGSGIRDWHMQIFNNYGQLVWETTKLDSKGAPIDGWDGSFQGAPAPQGVYVWQVSANFINGTEWKGNVIKGSLPKRVGTINLIR